MRNILSRGMPGLSLVLFGSGLWVSRHYGLWPVGYLSGIVTGMLITLLGAWVVWTARLELIDRERDSERREMIERRIHSEMVLKAEIIGLKKRISE